MHSDCRDVSSHALAPPSGHSSLQAQIAHEVSSLIQCVSFTAVLQSD